MRFVWPLALSACLCASAPPTLATFSPQGQPLPKVTEWAVWVCADEARNLPVGQLYAATAGHFVPLTPRTVQGRVNLRERRSAARIALLVLEGAAWALTAAQASQAVVIRDQWRALAPTVAGGIRLATTMIDRERRKTQAVESPPTVLTVPAGGCSEVTIFGAQTSDDKSFQAVIP